MRCPRRSLLLAVVFVVLQAAGTLTGPAAVRYGIDQGVTDRDLGALNRAAIVFIVAVIFVYVFGRLAILTIARLGEGFLRDLRERVFDHQMRLSHEFYDRTRTGTLVSRMTADVDSLQELVSQGLSMFIVNSLVFVGAIVVMVAMSWQLALGVLVGVPVLAKLTSWFRAASNKAYVELRDRVGGTLTSFQEGLSGVRVVQSFNQEDAFRHKFRTTNERQFRQHLRAESITAKYTMGIELVQGSAIAIILLYGGWLTGRDVVTVGTLAAFLLYLQTLFEPIQQMSQLFNTIQAAGAALHKLYELMDEPVAVDEKPGAIDLPATGDLEVERVSFRYGEAARAPRRVADRPPGRARGARRPHRSRQVDPREADGPLLRPDGGGGAVRRRRPARRHGCVPCASTSSWSRRRASSSAAPSATTCRIAAPAATDAQLHDAIDAARARATVLRVLRRSRHRGARARLQLLRR